MPPGAIVPEPSRYGVFYVKQQFGEDALGFNEACNSLVGLLPPAALNNPQPVFDKLRRWLKPYGLFAITPLNRQASNLNLSGEMAGLTTIAFFMPAIFLLVAVRPGNPVKIYGPTIGESPLNGTVVRVKPAGFTKVSSLGVDQQRVPVVIKLPDDARAQLKEQGRALGLAYRVQVRFYTDEKIDVLKVPRTALSRGAQQQWQLFAVRNGKAVIVPVKLGILNDNEAEITNGLKEGETIIKAPPEARKSNDRVTPL